MTMLQTIFIKIKVTSTDLNGSLEKFDGRVMFFLQTETVPCDTPCLENKMGNHSRYIQLIFLSVIKFITKWVIVHSVKPNLFKTKLTNK